MNKLKSLISAAVLTFALAVSAAGGIPACNPGETHSPPCAPSSATSEDPASGGGETETPPEVQTVEIVTLVELALQALLLA